MSWLRSHASKSSKRALSSAIAFPDSPSIKPSSLKGKSKNGETTANTDRSEEACREGAQKGYRVSEKDGRDFYALCPDTAKGKRMTWYLDHTWMEPSDFCYL